MRPDEQKTGLSIMLGTHRVARQKNKAISNVFHALKSPESLAKCVRSSCSDTTQCTAQKHLAGKIATIHAYCMI
jgi:hypothetical protein